MIGASAIAVAAAGFRRPPAGASGFELVDQSGSAGFTDVAALRVSISGGAWQTIAAAGLTLARNPTDPQRITVSGFASNAAALSARWHYEQEWPSEPYAPTQIAALWFRRASGPRPVNPAMPGLAVSQTDFANPVQTT